MSHLSTLELQREQADQLHNQDVTHIIAAEAEFANLFPDAQVDTLIWLQIPSSSSSALKMTCTGAVYPTNWLLYYNSAVLRESGFAKFAQLLDDARYQKRKASQLLLSGQLGPDATEIMKKIRYVLDLGPSTDFDLRSEHLKALTLPKGIVQYSMMTRLDSKRRVAISAAGGHDDACHCFDMKIRGAKCDEPGYWINGQLRPLTAQGDAAPSTSTTQTSMATTASAGDVQTEFNATFAPSTDSEAQGGVPSIDDNADANPLAPPSSPQGPEITHAPADLPTLQDGSLTGSIWDLPLAPEFRIDDYCEIRHIANVIRLLLAMAGKPLHLNSAARLYTIAGLAKLFHLRSSDAYHINTATQLGNQNDPFAGYAFANRLRSIVSDWFFAWNNNNIVDVLPEECFIIAWNIKLPVVARVAYRILVAERALQEAGTTDAQPRKYQSRQKSVFGRELSGLLDEDMETMLDHSSEAFVQRILKNRDAQVAKINSRSADLSISAPTENEANSNPAHAAAHAYEYESLTALFQSYSGPIRKLPLTAQVLAEFAETEQVLARSSHGSDVLLMAADEFPVANALAAVRRLLDRLAYIVRSCFPRAMPNTELLYTTYTESVQQNLSFYVRQSILHKNWFVHVYNDLPDDKKCMTAVFWRLLGRSVEEKLSTELGHVRFSELVEGVNDTLLTALVFAVPLGTAMSRNQLRLDLFDRLQPVLGPDVSFPSVLSLTQLDAFPGFDIRCALYDHAAQLYKKIYARDAFVPEFELAMLNPSPHLLLGLSADEFRFLPLWAGGDNDDTGAVFEPALPTAHLGPITPGPEYHTGTTNTSMSTPSIDDTFSMAGPPSISDAGNTERYRDAAMSDADTARRTGGGYNQDDDDDNDNNDDHDDSHSVSSSFIMVRDFDGLHLAAAQAASTTYSLPSSVHSSLPSNVSRAVQDGHSTLTGTSSAGGAASLATLSSSSVASSSSPSVALTTSSSFEDVVVVRPTASGAREAPNPNRPASFTGSPPLSAMTPGAANDVDFDFEYDDNEDGIYNYEDDDDVEDQEYYDDDDDDARSDDTVMPDREEVEQAMRQDVQMQHAESK